MFSIYSYSSPTHERDDADDDAVHVAEDANADDDAAGVEGDDYKDDSSTSWRRLFLCSNKSSF